MRLLRFFKSVGQEMRQVSWPDAHQTAVDTEVVVITSILFAIFFAIVDWAVQAFLQWIIG
ncbi:preprotein translocase subunit SecE [Levilactobacillus bambusae]|uniref:Protein translocase subunit SecE n=1 Tax=Levilactobacillus bambusae TaxID=2024736 RepID=A0A2V1MYX8_9LACO|nr:preprotein translocase subunit SecE [Levilactobacillus bambusae]PWF99374.1 preprotein translocase subunit SecE [Levilactobacillus bambusae]